MPRPPMLPAFAMAAALIVAMPVAIVQNRGLVPLAILLALASLPVLGAAGAWRAVTEPWAIRTVLGLGLWGMVSSLWALGPLEALVGGARLIALVLALALVLVAARRLDGRGQRAVLLALVWGVALGAVLLLVELAFGAPLNNALRGFPTPPRNPQVTKPAATVLLLLAPPAALAAWTLAGARLAVPLALLACAAVAASPSESARLGLLAAGGAAALAFAAPALARRALPGLLAVAVLAGPPVLEQLAKAATRADLLPPSAVHRALIWDFAAERAAERPLLGFGMDTARAIPGGRENPDAARLDRFGITGYKREVLEAAAPGGANLMPLHTHSMPLQVRLELGFVGLALCALFAFFAGRAAASLPGRGAFAAGAASAVAASVVGLLSYGVWQQWWWVAVTLAAVPLTASAALNDRRVD